MIKIPYSIFLDDLRSVNMVYPSNSVDYENFIEDFNICRTMEQAVSLIESKGYLPYYISFDNDLGEDSVGNALKEGIHFAHWIVESILDNKYTLPHNFSFFVHSANSIAGPEIRYLLNNFINFQIEN
jgi:hypothetical protein